jgi:hypothetical protein
VNTEIEPSSDDRFFLHWLPGTFLGLAVFSIGFAIYLKYFVEADDVALIVIVIWTIPFSLIAIAFHLKAKNNLKFQILDSPRAKMKFKSCLETVRGEEWKVIEIDEPNKIICETNFSWRSWGELVTIIFEEDHVSVNSRPSPYKMSSVATMGKNTKNIKIIETALNGS